MNLGISLQRTETKEAKDTTWAQFHELLDILHRGGTWANAWVITEAGADKTTHWWQVGKEYPSFADSPNLHQYFAVHPLSEVPKTNRKGEPMPPEKLRSQSAYVSAINCVFADIDAKDFESVADFRAHVKSIKPEPSVMVNSGRGVHLYWLFDKPFTIDDSTDRVRAEDLQRQWVEYTKSDTGAKDLARVLRVPGTVNWKSGCGKRAKFVRFKPELRYTMAELKATVSKQGESIDIALSKQSAYTPIQDMAAELAKAEIALSLLKPWRADDREEWVKVGMALAEFGDAGYRLWVGWSKQSDKFDEDDCERKWKSWQSAEELDDGRAVTRATLYHDAREDAADFDADDEHVLVSLVDAATDSTRSLTQRKQSIDELAARVLWYPDDVKHLVRDYAKSKRLTKAQFDQALESASKASLSPKDEDDDAVKSLFLARQWLDTYPETAWVAPDWFRFTDGIWVEHPENRVHREMTELALDLGVKPDANVIKNAVFFSRAYTELQWTQEHWDSVPHIVVVENGVLDLRQNQWPLRLEPWSSRYHNLVKLPVVYDPEATCPVFRSMLLENVSDGSNTKAAENEAKAVSVFLVQFAGLALSEELGDYEIGIWLFGAGGGGKSTILEGFKAVFGKYAGAIDVQALDKSSFGLEQILYKKLVYTNESDTKFLRQPGKINSVMSNEETSVEPKFKPSFTYKPRASVMFAMNELPGAANPDSGLFRRIKIVEVPPRDLAHRDPKVKKTMQSDLNERSGILNWMLKLMIAARKNGGPLIPKSVRMRTEDWQIKNDKVRRFVKEMCTVQSGLSIRSSELYDAFEDFFESRGLESFNLDRFNEGLERMGFEKRKHAGFKTWFGLALSDEAELERKAKRKKSKSSADEVAAMFDD